MLLQALCIISYSLMNSNWSYSPETTNLDENRQFFVPCNLEVWQMTFKNYRAPLLYQFKLYSSFHSHLWIQTGVTVRKQQNLVKSCFDLCDLDLWPWPFAWTSLLPMVRTLENSMLIRWREHTEKCVTDRQTNRQTDGRCKWKYTLKHT